MALDDFSSSAVDPSSTGQGKGKYGTPTSILDGLLRTESSGNQFAVNPKTGAMGPYQFTPSTVASLRKSGFAFDPFDPGQSRDAADYYISSLARAQGGDYNAALKAYGGFVTKDPSGYIAKVTGQQPVQQPAPQTGSYKPSIDDFSSGSIVASAPPAVPATGPAKAPQGAPAPTPGSAHSGGLEFLTNQASGALSTIAGGYRGIATTIGGLMHGKSFDEASSAGADAVTSTQQAGTYQPRTDLGKTLVNGFSSDYNPLNWSSVAGRFAGDKLSDAGLPGVGAAVNAGLTAAPMLLGLRGARAGVSNVSDAVAGDRGSVPVAERVEPTMEPPGAPQGTSQPTPGKPPTTQVAPAPKPMTGAAPDVTPTESLKTPQDLPRPEQFARAQVLRDAGFTQSRDSAIVGDNRARAVEYQMSKFDEPAGQAAAQQFAGEAQTLGNYTRGLIDKAGGTEGLDQGALYARGQAIVRPIQALRDWFDQKASALYGAADEKAQGQPVTLSGFKDTLGDASQLTNPDRVALQGATNAFAQKAGMTLGQDGSLSGTALQAETVRKWLNQERTNANGRYVDALKDSLDDDVGKSAGGPIYDQARKLWQLRQQTLGDPKGISSLLDEEGTNRAVPFERVPDNIVRMPQDQFAHVVGTLQNMPPELQGVANSALGEIKAQFYNKMLDGAQATRSGNGRPYWNGTAVRNVINDNSGKLQTLLSAEETQGLTTLRKAGDILSFDPSYPGAAAQAQAAVKHGLMSNVIGHAVTGAGTAAGAALGAPVTGAVLGRAIAERAQTGLAQRQALSAWQKRNINLRDIMGAPPP